MPDPIVAAVQADLAARSARGVQKYGVTLAREDLSEREWMQHHYEELLDAACYVKRRMIDLDASLARRDQSRNLS